MQKALSLYIDNGMYLTNKKRLLARKKEEEASLKTLMAQSPLPHLTLTHDGILLELSQVQSLAALKHSGLPLDFFEAAYITSCPYQLAKIKSADVTNVLPKLTPFFERETLV